MEDYSYLSYKINTDTPVGIVEISNALKAIQKVYNSTVYSDPKLLKSFDKNLYVSQVREGSQIYEIVTLGVATSLPLISDVNAVSTLFKNLKGLTDYFLRKSPAPKKIKPKDCTNTANLVSPASYSRDGVSLTVGQGNIVIQNLTLNVSQDEANKIINNAMAEKARLESPEIEYVENQSLRFIQANAVRTSTQGTSSADKGIIESISEKPHDVVFDEELADEKSKLLRANNFYTSLFDVDVEVARQNNRVKAYIIKRIDSI